MDRREPVAKLVSDAGGELADTGQAVFQTHLLFERDDRSQIREQTDDAMRGPVSVQRRRGETEVRRRRLSRRQFERTSENRLAGSQTFLNQGGHGLRMRQQFAIGPSFVRALAESEQTP